MAGGANGTEGAKLGAGEAHLPYWRGMCCGFPTEPVALAQNQLQVLVISDWDLHPCPWGWGILEQCT